MIEHQLICLIRFDIWFQLLVLGETKQTTLHSQVMRKLDIIASFNSITLSKWNNLQMDWAKNQVMLFVNKSNRYVRITNIILIRWKSRNYVLDKMKFTTEWFSNCKRKAYAWNICLCFVAMVNHFFHWKINISSKREIGDFEASRFMIIM